jgi:2-polyprenyl-3-methyl-5-hydroxy-6-metoxy-1,4-benzoquinol methylase
MNSFDKMFNHRVVDALRHSEREKYDRKYFDVNYWREDLPGLSGNRGLSYDDASHQQRFRSLYNAIIEQRGPRRLLDVGCGPGFLLEEALAHGIDARGLDVSRIARDLFSSRTENNWPNRFDVSPVTQMSFADEAFDLCICLDVLEHVIVFDIFQAVQELCRVCSRDIICSINLDNPYEFHPTILSRNTWVAIFESTGVVRFQVAETERLNQSIRAKYPEYDFFVFRRAG